MDHQLGLSPHSAIGKFEELICSLAAYMPFDRVRVHLKRHHNIEVTETLIRQTAERCGRSLIQWEEEQAMLNEVVTPDPGYEKSPEIQYVMIDGGHVPVRDKDEKYKEAKIGLLYRGEDLKKRNKGKGEENRISRKRFVSSLAQGVPHFEMLLRGLLGRLNAWEAKTVVFVTDGADWIDNLRERLFRNSIHILDWFHATEHLYGCAKTIFGTNQAEMHAWVNPLKQLLWDGHVEEVCDRILFEIKRHPKKETELRNLYNYYNTRREKMRYAHFREQGFTIGSGAVESSMKYLIQSRLKGAGMRWDINKAPTIIKLLEKTYEDTWDDVWSYPRKLFSYN